MKEQVKKKWVKALRSGKFSQTQGTLKDESGYCCLGVLCELAVQEGVIKAGRADATGYYTYGRNSQDLLPPTVQRWAGIKSENPDVKFIDDGESINVSLSAVNDNGVEFDKIADLIEENL